MSPQIVDAVAVFHGKLSACFHQLVFGAQTVLDDEQRLSPAMPVVVEDNSQADWVDRPTGSICEPHSEPSPRVGGRAVEQGTERRAFRAPSFSGFLRPVGVVVCAFQLIGGDGAAKEETRRETIRDGWIPLRSRASDRGSVGARFVGTRV